MTHRTQQPDTACMAALALPEGAEVPEWVHLVPTVRGEVQTVDGRGPYVVEDADALIAASFADETRLQIDENHAQDLAAPLGLASPARGWITELQARADGIWGKVEWTAAGGALLKDRAYRAMSPVILHDKAKRITRILRASLVNRPNFRGLATLNQETDMFDVKKLAKALNLAEDASEDQIFAAVGKLTAAEPAAQSALGEIASALGVEGGDAKAVLAAAKLAKAGNGDVVVLQSQVTSLQGEIDALKKAGSRAKSEAFIDGAIKERRSGVNRENREELIAFHMAQPVAAEKVVSSMAKLDASHARIEPPAQKDGDIALNAEQLRAVKLMGVDPEAYRKTLAAERKEETI